MKKRIRLTSEQLETVVQLRQVGTSWLGVQKKAGIPRRIAQREYLQWEQSQAREQLQDVRREVAAGEFKLDQSQVDTWDLTGAEQTEVEFVGYDFLMMEDARILKTRTTGQEEEPRHELVLNRTPFYAEAGGQVADRGTLLTDMAVAEVLDVQRPLPALIVHKILVKRGMLRKGDRVKATVEEGWRGKVVKNHTATHLLHEALHRVLGDHVRQEGSLVAPDRLRFDFRHFGPLTAQEIARIERMVNEQLWRNLPVNIDDAVPYEEAIARGARAFFADKYADRVRVVAVPGFGLELCGGTHVQAIGEIGIFKVGSEGGVAAGIRRIEAYTGPGAYDYLLREEAALQESADALRTRPLELPEKVDRLSRRGGELEQENQRLRSRLAATLVEDLLTRVETVEGIRVVRGRVEHFDQKGLRDLVDRIRTKLGSGVVVLGTLVNNRVGWVAGVTADTIARVHAGRLVRELARMTGGEGGGRADLAEAGGKDPSRFDHALSQVPGLVRRLLNGEAGQPS